VDDGADGGRADQWAAGQPGRARTLIAIGQGLLAAALVWIALVSSADVSYSALVIRSRWPEWAWA